MTDQELLTIARECVKVGGYCTNCPFDRSPAEGRLCVYSLISALAERVEKLGEHSARYAEMLAVMKERERWINVEERLPEPMEWVLCRCRDGRARILRYDHVIDNWDFTVLDGHGYAFPREIVTHWRPLPEEPEEVEHGTADI